MVKEYARAASDCAEGLKHEQHVELTKVRLRQVSALKRLGRLDDSIATLNTGIARAAGDVPPGTDAAAAVENLRALRKERDTVQEVGWVVASASEMGQP